MPRGRIEHPEAPVSIYRHVKSKTRLYLRLSLSDDDGRLQVAVDKYEHFAVTRCKEQVLDVGEQNICAKFSSKNPNRATENHRPIFCPIAPKYLIPFEWISTSPGKRFPSSAGRTNTSGNLVGRRPNWYRGQAKKHFV